MEIEPSLHWISLQYKHWQLPVHTFSPLSVYKANPNPYKAINAYTIQLLAATVQTKWDGRAPSLTVECRQNLIRSWMSVEGASSIKSRHSLKLMFRLPSLSILWEELSWIIINVSYEREFQPAKQFCSLVNINVQAKVFERRYQLLQVHFACETKFNIICII